MSQRLKVQNQSVIRAMLHLKCLGEGLEAQLSTASGTCWQSFGISRIMATLTLISGLLPMYVYISLL